MPGDAALPERWDLSDGAAVCAWRAEPASYWSRTMSFRQAEIAVVAAPLVMVGSVPAVAGSAPRAAAVVCR